MNEFPYLGANETWEEFADAQLDHEPTLAQALLHVATGLEA
jgi:hypothetical protein